MTLFKKKVLHCPSVAAGCGVPDGLGFWLHQIQKPMESCCLGLLLILAGELWCLEGPGKASFASHFLPCSISLDSADLHMLGYGQDIDYVERGPPSHHRSQVGLKRLFSISTERGSIACWGATVAAALKGSVLLLGC